MSGTLIRDRFAVVFAKVETTSGTDVIAGSPVQADFITGDASIRFNPQLVQDPSFSGTLDSLAPVIGGTQPMIELRVPLRGSGTAGTAPAFGSLLRACTMAETVTAAAIAATAATAGTAGTYPGTATATLATPYAATAQLYRGMPAILAVNPVGGAVTPILNYTVGRVATLGDAFAATLDTSTTVALPINVLYGPSSDESVHKTVTVYIYRDGYRWRFTGCTGNVRLELANGGMGILVFSLMGQELDQGASANPSGINAGVTVSPPIFQAGKCRLFGVKAQVSQARWDLGVNVALPPDPEATNSVGPGVPVGRTTTVDFDPLIDTVTQANIWTQFRAGFTGAFYAQLGTTAGNRFLISQPGLRMSANDPGSNGGFSNNAIRGQANSPDAGLFICQY
jgi:hypothetical protein